MPLRNFKVQVKPFHIPNFLISRSGGNFEVTGSYLTKALRGISHMFLVTIFVITALPNNDLTGQQTQTG